MSVQQERRNEKWPEVATVMVQGRFRILGLAVLAGLAGLASAGISAFGQSSSVDGVASRSEADRLADVRVAELAREFSADAAADDAFARILVELLGVEYRTPMAEIQWALGEREAETEAEALGWGEITILAYLQATTGWSFDELVRDGAHNDFSRFVDTMEMSHDRMATSLDTLGERAVRERNSRIFDRVRSEPRLGAIPDLGAGFGLFQESLDFRQLDPPAPTKVHEGTVFGPQPIGGGR